MIIKVDRKSTEALFLKAYNASDGHFFDSDECWYCGYRDGILAVLAQLLGKGKITVQDNRVGSNITSQALLDLYLQLKEN